MLPTNEVAEVNGSAGFARFRFHADFVSLLFLLAPYRTSRLQKKQKIWMDHFPHNLVVLNVGSRKTGRPYDPTYAFESDRVRSK